jgi:hypothetical protein
MPVENSWYIEGRVTITRLIGNVTLEELEAGSREGTALNESGVAPIYGLVDMTQLEHFPLQVADFRKIIQQGKSDKLEWIVVYGIPNGIANFLATLFSQLIRTNFKVVKTEEEALEVIRRLEGGLPVGVPTGNQA